MKNIYALLFCLLFIANTQAQHPRLFFDAAEVATLRSKMTREPFKSMVKQVRNNYNQLKASTDAYDAPMSAAHASFMYLLTDSDYYAQEARRLVTLRLVDVNADCNTGQGWAKPVKGLTEYWLGTYVSIAYDFCYNAPSWDAAFRSRVSDSLWSMAKMIIDNGGCQQNTNTASNWQGIRGAAGGICLLATDRLYPKKYMDKTIEKYARYLYDNYGNMFTSRGWNIEGLGYTYYPVGNFIGPFAIALKRQIPNADFRKYAGFTNTYWTMYSSLSTAVDLSTFGGLHPDWGDDNPHVTGEGVFGQAFYFLPDSLKPAAKYWFDRSMAVRTIKPFDDYRYGVVYSYLYYPDSLISEDPSENRIWEGLSLDPGGNGYYTYRNKYKNGLDLLGQMYIKLRGNKGHNGPDALTYRIVGSNTAWAVGGGRYGLKILTQDAYIRHMNTLYPVNPATATLITQNNNSGTIVGSPLILPDGSGHVISSIVKNNVNTANQKRWFVTDYDSSATSAMATYIIGDISDDGYFWQLSTWIQNTLITGSDTFLITSPDGHSMRGKILYPISNYRFSNATRLRGTNFGADTDNRCLHFQSDDGDYLVILTIVAPGMKHPMVSATGTGVINRNIIVGSKTFQLQTSDITYNGSTINKLPIASFTADRLAGTSPLTVKFDASTSSDPENESLSYAWDFGDGSTASGINATHTFTAGTYTPRLVVTDAAGNSDILLGNIASNPPASSKNMKPFGAIYTPADNSIYNQHDTIIFSIWADDADGYIKKIEYYLGTTLLSSNSVYPFIFSWNDVPSGIYYANLKIYDDRDTMGISSQKKVTINVSVDMLLTSETNITDASVYPNPTQGALFVQLPSDESGSLRIFDVSGSLILSGILDQNINSFDLTGKPSGMYILRVAYGESLRTFKLLLR